MDDVKLMEWVKNRRQNVLRIIMSGESDWQFLKEAINRAQIYRFLSKLWDNFDLTMAVEQALRFSYLQKHQVRLI